MHGACQVPGPRAGEVHGTQESVGFHLEGRKGRACVGDWLCEPGLSSLGLASLPIPPPASPLRWGVAVPPWLESSVTFRAAAIRALILGLAARPEAGGPAPGLGIRRTRVRQVPQMEVSQTPGPAHHPAPPPSPQVAAHLFHSWPLSC